MSTITLEVPEDLAERLRRVPDRDVPLLLETGLRGLDAGPPEEYQSTADVMEFLARLPTPEETLGVRASPALQARIRVLLEKNREDSLSPEEEREWEYYDYLEYLVQLAKARALARLHSP